MPTIGEDNVFYLNVPYNMKDEAKKMGCRWDPCCKDWYIIEDHRNYDKVLERFAREYYDEIYCPMMKRAEEILHNQK